MAVSKALRYQIFRRDNNTCRYCGASAPGVKLVIDHVVPEALGGKSVPENLVTACDPCNNGKSATPADASTVNQVAEDAIRWSRARKVAADQMLEDLAQRERNRVEFKAAWDRWKTKGGETIELPANWSTTVDRLLAAGLPMPLLLDAIDIAMGRKIRADSIFSYMCGVAWNRVTAIDEEAQKAVGGTVPSGPAEDDYPVQAFCQEIFDIVGEDIVEVATDELAEEVKSGYLDIPSLEMPAELVRRIVLNVSTEAGSMRYFLKEMTNFLPQNVMDAAAEDAGEAIERDSELTAEQAMSVIGAISNELAAQYLNRMTDEERIDWLVHTQTYQGDFRIRATALKAAWYKRGREVPRGACGVPLSSGAICGERAQHIVRIASCGSCRPEPCGTHLLWCDEHMEWALEGRLNNWGAQLVVAEYRRADDEDKREF